MRARRGTTFDEVMEGFVRLSGESRPRTARLALHAEADTLLRPLGSTTARVDGRLTVEGWARDGQVSGSLEIAPVAARRIRYRLTFTADDGEEYLLDGWKSVTPLRPLRSMTTLPFALRPAAARGCGTPVGEGVLRFRAARDLLPFLAGWRFPQAVPTGPAGAAADWFAPRSTGRPGRLEVWYTTVTDPLTGTGLWLHHEIVSPSAGGPAQALGWAAVFPPDEPPRLARFGPAPTELVPTGPAPTEPVPTESVPPADGHPAPGFHAGPVSATAGRLRGTAGDIRWDLTVDDTGAPPLHTFPRAAWRHGLLPAAHAVPQPTAACTGTVTVAGRTLRLDAAPGAGARIDGRGNAARWGWLHADLGGGEVLEVVAAVSALPLLRALPPLVFLRLRTGGRDWPRGDWRSALGRCGLGRFRAQLGLPDWTVTGRAGLRRIRVEVHLPPESTVAVDYRDPDGTTRVCRNSERADATVVLERWRGRWRTERRLRLAGTAHAEVGTAEVGTA